MQKFRTYLFEYYHEGSRWVLEIPAPNMEDAQARVDKLPFAKPLGELIAKIPARAGLLARFWCFLANLFPRRKATAS